MSYKKDITLKDLNQLDFDMGDPKLTETLNLRMTKAVYFTINQVAKLQNIPMSEYARFLIEWHMLPSLITGKLLTGVYSMEEGTDINIAAFEERLLSLLDEIKRVNKIQIWAMQLLDQLERVKEEIKAVTDGATITNTQDFLKLMEETEKDFMDIYLDKAKMRARRKNKIKK